ncbi:PREDICTED: L-type lectin-domain [Prunus dulcis]|uniref:PREDICTED: L-type lectin-domain n=1 Tax=Prunus dulcis TaxID=3755 RepID=A0A5E4EA64_PRUDU|nr:PREDICTED: L-type lectin-domain [Prunus dulcis]
MAILGLHYTLHNSDFFTEVATYISIIRCIADFHVLVGCIAMSLSRLSTFRLQSLKNCSIVLFMFFNFFQRFVHPLSFSIKRFGLDANNILYEGDAAPSSFGVIELSTITDTDIYFRTGRATYAEPLHLWDSAKLADFTTNFSFVIDIRNRTLFANGIVFFIAPVHYPIPPNSAGGELGLLNSTTRFEASQNQIVMVEFDTFTNQWDPLGSHVGININTISSVVHASWDAGGNSGKMAHVQITYSASTKNLTVVWTYEENTNVAISSLSYAIDLRKVLPEWVTIGFSTSNGFYRERNAIYTWDFISNSEKISTKKKERRVFLIGAVAVSVFILIPPQILRGKPCQELVAATNDFANDRRLGQGGSGQVYKGIIQDLGCTVAVKRIFPESKHYESVFINDVKIISRLIHRNPVQFIGWCHEQGKCLLVYAYMPNSSLDTHLFGSRTTMQWDFRYKIALDSATALHYLHEDAEQCVLYRDIKSANILLDNDFKTKLGDFGIAKLVDPRFRTQTTGVVGTFGYIAPEYANGGKASEESDMYSFGVVALELACGRRTHQDEEYHIPLFRWVWQLYLAGNLLSAADERLDMNFVRNEMECLLIVGLWCTRPNKKERPKAWQVMKVLQLEAPLPELPHDMHDYPQPQPQPQQQTGSSQLSLTYSFETVGR